MRYLIIFAMVAFMLAGGELTKAWSDGAGNTICPVMGGRADQNISYVHEGRKYYFCCPGCIEKFKKHPEQYIKAMGSPFSGELEGSLRVVKVKAYKYGFDPDPIVVKKDETVRLEVTSVDVAHGLGIKELGVNLAVDAGETKTAEFIAEKAGEFHIHCTVFCGSGHGKMHGTLKVLE